MKCTDCGREIKPVVALDIDGTLGDYHGHLLDFARRYWGRHEWNGATANTHWAVPTDYDGSVRLSDWYCVAFNVSTGMWRDMKLAYRQGGMKRSMPMYPLADLLASSLRKHDGVELWITTTRPYNRLDNIDPDTQEWLRRRFIRYDHLMYDDHKYKRLADQVDPERVVAVLDDLPDLYDEAAATFGDGVPILRQTRYNSSIVRPTIATDLVEAREAIKERVGAWREQHQ